MVFATWAARVPAIQHQLGLGVEQLAVAFTALNAGALVGLQLGGVLVPRVGSSAALRVALPAYTAALLAPVLAVSLASLSVGLFALTVANSVVDVAMNAHGVAVERGYGRPILSSLHAMHSLGGMVGGAPETGSPPGSVRRRPSVRAPPSRGPALPRPCLPAVPPPAWRGSRCSAWACRSPFRSP
jgi:hypothetical protein